MGIRPEVLPFLGIATLVALLIGLLLLRFTPLKAKQSAIIGGLFLVVFGGYFLWFFRDPERIPPDDPNVIVAAADGVVAKITTFSQKDFRSIQMLSELDPDDLQAFEGDDVVRVSIFLSLFSVHVNRMPIGGKSRFLGYFPGKHYFTFEEKSSDVNQHNSILVSNERTSCLINQIVGPVCRRVVYWLDDDAEVEVRMGDDFGMMKFGSRLDMYFPSSDIKLIVSEETPVVAGETVIGHYR
jgi:phosphatidylserine decarboxylase